MASRVGRIGRFLSVLVALVLIATSVMPLVAQARGDGSGAHAHAIHEIDHDDHDDGHGSDPGDLAHHAQSHAQSLATAASSSVPTSLFGRDVRFPTTHDHVSANRAGRVPFEPPRG